MIRNKKIWFKWWFTFWWKQIMLFVDSIIMLRFGKTKVAEKEKKEKKISDVKKMKCWCW